MHQLLALNPGSNLHITGHSLGAAMAVLSAAHIQTQENITVDELYTYGLPRVGDLAFSKWFHQALPQAIHVTHYHDIVPHLPPQWLFGYHHTPTEVWYTAETGIDNYKVRYPSMTRPRVCTRVCVTNDACWMNRGSHLTSRHSQRICPHVVHAYLCNRQVCDGTGEDPTCADSVHFWDYSAADHCHYLDYPICGCVKPNTTAAQNNLRH